MPVLSGEDAGQTSQMKIKDGNQSGSLNCARCAVAVGNFDGVHLGHKALVETIRMRAAELGGPSVVYTFDPHPLKVINPSACPPELTDFSHKAALLEKLGLDVLVRVTFDHEYAAREPAWFAEEVLGTQLEAAEVWIGPDFAFGRNRTGTAALLAEMGAKTGFAVRTLAPFLVDGERVSSTRVRQAVASRDFRLAGKLLGRPWSLHGPVVHGEGRGRGLGFPTANLLPREECMPPPGVYAARARLDFQGPWIGAAVNIGANPTFNAPVTTVEAHLLDNAGDLYGRSMELRFVEGIRGEIAFASAKALAEHIARDIEEIRRVLSENPA